MAFSAFNSDDTFHKIFIDKISVTIKAIEMCGVMKESTIADKNVFMPASYFSNTKSMPIQNHDGSLLLNGRTEYPQILLLVLVLTLTTISNYCQLLYPISPTTVAGTSCW